MAQKYPKVSRGDIVRSYWQALKPLKWWAFLTIVSIIVGTTFSILTPLFYRTFFNILNTSGGNKIAAGGQLVHALFFILLFNLLGWIFYRSATFTNPQFQGRGMALLRQQGFDYMLSHSYSFFADNFTGSLTQRINRYARAFERLTDRIIWNVIPLFIRIVGISIIIWTIKPVITIILITWILIFLTFNFFFARYKHPFDENRATIDSHATAVLSDSITNHNTIQLFTGYNQETKSYKNVTDEQAAATIFSWKLDGIMEAVQSFLIILMEFLLFYFSIKYWQLGMITLGTFVLLQSYLIGFIGQLWDFSRVVRDFYEGFADAQEMVEILALPHEIKDTPTAKPLIVERGSVEFKKVIFSFNDTRTVLDGINLDIKGGEKVALIGPSGAGKSTIVRLILRLYNVSGGQILIDGQNIQQVTQESLHKNVSLVPQDPILFHRTLMENIRYGRKDATDEEVIKAAHLAHCDEFIKDLPLGYKTFVGERGIKLSGGERQRVAIARAILKNAPILILDEATSSLDSNSEALIQDALEKLMEDKTTIVIAHRLSTIRKMDRIIVVEGGKILEEGSHDTLIEKEGSLYKKLWELQAGGFLVQEPDSEDSK